MAIEEQRKRMAQHIHDQALFQGKRVKVAFLRAGDGEEVFKVEGAKGSTELALRSDSLGLEPVHLWEIDERIAAAISTV